MRLESLCATLYGTLGMRCMIGHVLGVRVEDSVCLMMRRLQRRLPLMWWGRVQLWIDPVIAPEWKARWVSPLLDGGARCIMHRMSQNFLLVRMRWELFTCNTAASEV